jgi:hypothetical protein
MEKQEGKGTILVRGGRNPGKGLILGPDAAPLIKRPTPTKAPEERWLRAGDRLRALGRVYVVRKVTRKDILIRPYVGK